MSELKSMLNKVPVPSAGTGNALTSKIVLGTAMTLIIAAAAYWFVQDEEPPQATEQKAPTEHHIPAEKPALPNAEPQRQKQKQQTAPADKRPVETDKNQTSAGTEHSKPSLAKRPDPLSAPAAKGNDSSGNNLDARNSGKDSSNLNGELSPQIKPLAPVTDSTLDRKLTPAGKPE